MAEESVFETHEFVQRLIEAGMTPATANAIAKGMVGLVDSHCASKQDLADLGTEFRSEMALLRAEFALLRAEMAAMENRIVIRLGGFITALAVIAGALAAAW